MSLGNAITIPDWNGDPISFLYEFICGIDEKTWLALIGIMVAFAVVRAVINGIKHSVVAVSIALVLLFGYKYADKIMKDVGILYTEGYVLVDNESIHKAVIKTSDIEEIILSKRDGKAVVTIKMVEKKDKECIFNESYYAPIRMALKKLDFDNIVIE